MIKYILLGFLNYAPMTGYDLKQLIDESCGHFWHAHHSQIYTTLRKMEKDGLVTSHFEQQDSAPDRRIYTITAQGKDEFRLWLNTTLTEPSPIKEELLVHTFFSARRDPQDVLTELRLQREQHLQKAAEYQAIQSHIRCEPPQFPGAEQEAKFWQLTLNMGIRYEEMYLAWLDETIQFIEHG